MGLRGPMSPESDAARSPLTMDGFAHPRSGDGVSILVPRIARLRGRVVERLRDGVTIEIDHTTVRLPFHFDRGAQIALEWTERRRVMRSSATVESAATDPRPTLEVELVGRPAPVDRRGDRRFPVVLTVSAWTPAQPTHRFTGHTVDLSVGGALLSLPALSAFASTVDLRIDLPDGQLTVSGSIRWRADPGLVGVRFQHLGLAQQARLAEYLPR